MVEEFIYDRLKESGTVTNIVGTKIYPQLAPQNAALPYVTYQRIDTPRLRSLDGPVGLASPRVQIDCWSARYKEAKQLGEAIRKMLDGFKGSYGGEVVQGVFLEDERDAFELPVHANEVGSHRVSQDYTIWIEESVAA